jgi:hypothetical protein
LKGPRLAILRCPAGSNSPAPLLFWENEKLRGLFLGQNNKGAWEIVSDGTFQKAGPHLCVFCLDFWVLTEPKSQPSKRRKNKRARQKNDTGVAGSFETICDPPIPGPLSKFIFSKTRRAQNMHFLRVSKCLPDIRVFPKF